MAGLRPIKIGEMVIGFVPDCNHPTGLEQERLSKIVLSHKSLDRLNSKDPDKQYTLVRENPFVKQYNSDGPHWEDSVRRELLKNGYAGLVDFRFEPKLHHEGEDTVGEMYVDVSGSPIVEARGVK